MKTPEEIHALQAEVVSLNKKLAELSEEELKTVIGGVNPTIPLPIGPEFWDSWNPCPFIDRHVLRSDRPNTDK